VSNTESIDRRGESGVGKALQQRIMRAVEHFHRCGEDVEWVSEDRCKVPSQRFNDRKYLVIFGKDGERCQCVDFNREHDGKRLGACVHTITALISWAKRVDYRVVSRHDSRLGDYVYDVVETRAGVDRIVGTFAWVGSAYHTVWILRGWHSDRDAA
jgi:hypothetical protein